jgi:hypothetical protein
VIHGVRGLRVPAALKFDAHAVDRVEVHCPVSSSSGR